MLDGQRVKLDYPTTFHTQPVWRWRNDAPDFSMAIGSCAYIIEPRYDRPGTPYGGEYEIFSSIYQKKPDLMLWLGDNTYLREADWFTQTGIFHRYTHTRSVPELQPLLANTHHYAIWDDHDFGPNDSDRSFIHKDLTLKAFDLFWGNPTLGLPDVKGAISYFQYLDIDFFMLDDRYYRSPNGRKTGVPTLLGAKQLEWLIDALVASDAPFKMVAIGGQVLNTAPVAENYIHHHPMERAYLLKRIEEENITGVIFLTGDRHHTELSYFVNEKGNAVYDLTVSPLTAGYGGGADEDNRLRLPGTFVADRNFGMLDFSGPQDARKLTIRIFETAGKELWRKVINAPKPGN